MFIINVILFCLLILLINMYRASHEDSLYVSLDLKSADFHVLRLVLLELIKEKTRESWVKKSIPKIIQKIPFSAKLKPLRVRVLGKVLHKKNAALQCHCLRILVRLLLVSAHDNDTSFFCIEIFFQFSCDELCLKLKQKTTLESAFELSKKIKKHLKQMSWQNHLPVRIETFKLYRKKSFFLILRKM